MALHHSCRRQHLQSLLASAGEGYWNTGLVLKKWVDQFALGVAWPPLGTPVHHLLDGSRCRKATGNTCVMEKSLHCKPRSQCKTLTQMASLTSLFRSTWDFILRYHRGELYHLYSILIAPWQSGKGSEGGHSANSVNAEHCFRVVEGIHFLYITGVDSKDMQVSNMQKK